MNFNDLQTRFINELKSRVHSGVATERGLARDAGISQPHLHNVLKGKRALSSEKADQVLRCLHLDLLHLIEPAELRELSRRR